MYLIVLFLFGLCYGKNIQITDSNVYINSDLKHAAHFLSEEGVQEDLRQSIFQLMESFFNGKQCHTELESNRTNSKEIANERTVNETSPEQWIERLNNSLTNFVLFQIDRSQETIKDICESLIENKLQNVTKLNTKILSDIQEVFGEFHIDGIDKYNDTETFLLPDFVGWLHLNLKKTLSLLQSALRGSENKNFQLENQLQSLGDELFTLKAYTKEWQLQREDMSLQLSEINQKLNEYNSTIEELKNEFQALKEKHRTYISTVNRTEENDVEETLVVGKDCQDLYKKGFREDGVYKIRIDGFLIPPIKVYCDMSDGGWIVIQKRIDGSLDFERDWNEYAKGFGNLNHEFWLGLENIHRLTKTPRSVKFDLQLLDGTWMYLEYSSFSIKGEERSYTLDVSGHRYGFTRQSFQYNSRHKFATKDRDNNAGCAKSRRGGWWYGNCTYLSINTLYNVTNSESGLTEHYEGYKNFKKTTMKIR